MHTRCIVKTSGFTRGVCKIWGFYSIQRFSCGIPREQAILRKSKTPRKSPEKSTFLSLAFCNAPSLHTVDFSISNKDYTVSKKTYPFACVFRERKMRTNFFGTNFLNTAKGQGCPGQTTETSLQNPRKTNFRGRARTFRPPPLCVEEPPTPPGGLRTQKVNLCALYFLAERKGGSGHFAKNARKRGPRPWAELDM